MLIAQLSDPHVVAPGTLLYGGFLLHRWQDGDLVTHVVPADESLATPYD